MIGLSLYILAVIPLIFLCLMPWLTKIGEARLQRDKLELQALAGQIISEMRAEYR